MTETYAGRAAEAAARAKANGIRKQGELAALKAKNQKLVSLLRDVELLISVNATNMTDGSPIHKAILTAIGPPRRESFIVQSEQVRGERRIYWVVDVSGKKPKRVIGTETHSKQTANRRCHLLNIRNEGDTGEILEILNR